ncbi:hypothetical protein JCM10207_000668 [Rhodosporidiobolus poonsookiae]
MDRSYSSTVLATPSPLDRRSPLSSSTLLSKAQLAQSVAPSAGAALGATTTVQPLSFSPQNAPVRQTQSSILPSSGSPLKSVRFSPAHSSTAYATGYVNQYSSAPPSRIQSFATPPRSYSSPSLLRTAQQNYGFASGAVATPPRQDGQAQVAKPSPTAQAKQLLHAGEQKVQSALHKPVEAVQEVKKKLEVMPLGRGEASRRLRVNTVLLVAWWVSSRTTFYRFAAGHLVAAAPQLDTPLHICETLLLLLLCYNIIDSFRTLKTLSSLPASTVVAPLSSASPARPGPTRSPSASFTLGTPARSSPKTRPSPSPFASGSPGSPLSLTAGSTSPAPARLRTASSPFRASALASPSPPTPQTPTSALRGADAAAASALRRSLGGRASPAPSTGSTYGTPIGLRTPGSVAGVADGVGPADEVTGALLAFEARHSPGGAGGSPATQRRLVVDSQEAIDRLFD